MNKILITTFLLLVSDVVKAQDIIEDRKVIYKTKTEIDFEGLDIKGELVKPSSSLILERKQSKFNPLIVLRTDWSDKIDESVDEIK